MFLSSTVIGLSMRSLALEFICRADEKSRIQIFVVKVHPLLLLVVHSTSNNSNFDYQPTISRCNWVVESYEDNLPVHTSICPIHPPTLSRQAPSTMAKGKTKAPMEVTAPTTGICRIPLIHPQC